MKKQGLIPSESKSKEPTQVSIHDIQSQNQGQITIQDPLIKKGKGWPGRKKSFLEKKQVGKKRKGNTFIMSTQFYNFQVYYSKKNLCALLIIVYVIYLGTKVLLVATDSHSIEPLSNNEIGIYILNILVYLLSI